MCPSEVAHIRAVCPRPASFAFTSAPCSSSSLTPSRLPVRAVVISAVSPPGSAVFASAPALSSRPIIPAFPFMQASDSGVTA